MKAVKTPTLDKAMAVLSESHTIGEFLDWLRDERKIQLAEYVEATWTCEVCGPVSKDDVGFTGWMSDDSAMWRHKPKKCERVMRVLREKGSIPIEKFEGGRVDHVAAGLYPATKVMPDQLLHDYFEIDPAAEEKERRALLESLRKR